MKRITKTLRDITSRGHAWSSSALREITLIEDL